MFAHVPGFNTFADVPGFLFRIAGSWLLGNFGAGGGLECLVPGSPCSVPALEDALRCLAIRLGFFHSFGIRNSEAAGTMSDSLGLSRQATDRWRI